MKETIMVNKTQYDPEEVMNKYINREDQKNARK